jgi:micrococcal nuclease
MKRLSFRSGRGVRVTLTTDTTQDRRDRYGRLLAYVTRSDRKNLGEAQLRAGLAKVYVFRRNFKLVSRFRAAQSAARSANRGAWGECGGDFHTPA